MKYILSVAAFSLVLFSSCGFLGGRSIDGDGNVVAQNRAITGFNSIEVSSAIDVTITQDSSFSVKVETDNNLQEFVEVYNDNGVLRIRQKNNTSLDPTHGIKVSVSAPMIRSIDASGACNIVGKNKLTTAETFAIGLSGSCDVDVDVKAPKVDVDVSGSCSVILRGETKDFYVQGSGATSIKAFELLSENAEVDMSGAGDVELYASVKINAEGSGSTSIRYKGNAAVSSNISGAGGIKKVE